MTQCGLYGLAGPVASARAAGVRLAAVLAFASAVPEYGQAGVIVSGEMTRQTLNGNSITSYLPDVCNTPTPAPPPVPYPNVALDCQMPEDSRVTAKVQASVFDGQLRASASVKAEGGGDTVLIDVTAGVTSSVTGGAHLMPNPSFPVHVDGASIVTTLSVTGHNSTQGNCAAHSECSATAPSEVKVMLLVGNASTEETSSYSDVDTGNGSGTLNHSSTVQTRSSYEEAVEIFYSLGVSASGSAILGIDPITGAPLDGVSATADYSHTVSLISMVVLDAEGNDITQYFRIEFTGDVVMHPLAEAAEPATLALLAAPLGFLLAAGRVRRRSTSKALAG